MRRHSNSNRTSGRNSEQTENGTSSDHPIVSSIIVTRRSTDTRAVANPTLRRALELIGGNLSRPYGADQLAAALGLPRFKVDRLFASGLGRSVGAEILRLRIARAKLLLKGRKLTLSDIARQIGFCHASHLSNSFKRATGLSPKAWLKS